MQKEAGRTMAVSGGQMTRLLNSVAELQALFYCIRLYGSDALTDFERSLVCDRLYKRYVADDDVPALIVALGKISKAFALVQSNRVNWAMLGVEVGKPGEPGTTLTLASVWEEDLERIRKCARDVIEMIEIGHRWKRPLVISRADFASLISEKKRPLTDYDELEGDPFWLAEPVTLAPSSWYKDGKEVAAGTPGAVSPDYVSSDNGTATFVHKLE